MANRKKDFLSSLKKEGIQKKVIDAFDKIDQNVFFDQIFKSYYYSNEPIPIGYGEKGDPAITLAKMINYLCPDKNSRVLEIGTGSGYSTAILSKLVSEVVTVDFYENLALTAKEKLAKLKITNVRFMTGDITEFDDLPGVFDRIIIFAASSQRPLFLIPHLKEKGVMVFPMGPSYQQQITVMENEPGKDNSIYKVSFHEMCIFNPLKGIN